MVVQRQACSLMAIWCGWCARRIDCCLISGVVENRRAQRLYVSTRQQKEASHGRRERERERERDRGCAVDFSSAHAG